MHDAGLIGGIAEKPSTHTKPHSLRLVTEGLVWSGYEHCTPACLICKRPSVKGHRALYDDE